LPQIFVKRLLQQYGRIVPIKDNATLQYILKQLTGCFHVLLEQWFSTAGLQTGSDPRRFFCQSAKQSRFSVKELKMVSVDVKFSKILANYMWLAIAQTG